jgi:G3E family GTPase
MPDKVLASLTGYLGAGKTAAQPHPERAARKKYAVIVNEHEIGIDGELVVGVDEEQFEMNNGCICRTVRGAVRIIDG